VSNAAPCEHVNFTGPIIGNQQWLMQMKQQLAKAVQGAQSLTPSASW
jgi:hypothetical protein